MGLAWRALTLATAISVVSYGLVAIPAAAGPATMTDADDIRVQLPVSYVRDLVVDDTHQRVFASSRDGLLVLDFAGQVHKTFPGGHGRLALAPDDSALYAIRSGDTKLARIDTTNHTVQDINLGVCVRSTVVTGGKLWFSYTDCDVLINPALGWYDPATGEVRTGLVTLTDVSQLRAAPDRPDRLAVIGERGQLRTYDGSVDPPVKLAERQLTGPTTCEDGTVSSDGELLFTACVQAPGHEVFQTSDLSAEPALYDGRDGNAVDIASGGGYVAAGSFTLSGDDIQVYDTGSGTPGSYVRGYEFRGFLVPRTLKFSDSGLLFAVESTAEETFYLNVFHKPTTPATKVVLYGDQAAPYRGTISMAGVLTPAPGSATVSITRTDRTGTYNLGTVPVLPEGLFGFEDTPHTTGPVTYTAHYAGDSTHRPGSGKATVIVRPLPYDVNGDGYAETVIGVPFENLGSLDVAGMFHLLYGSSSGPKASGSLGIHQDTPGVPGTVERNDQLGTANTSGDFNGDGFADVAVSASWEALGTADFAGMVLIFYGSAGGLRTDNVAAIDAHDGGLPTLEFAYFGSSLAAGDFNGGYRGDGRDDLAVGSPRAGPGYVSIFHGSDTGLRYREILSQDTQDVPGSNQDWDGFGHALAVGDADGDGNRDDLAIGVPAEREDLGWSTGAVTVLYGAVYGLIKNGSQRWTKNSPGVPGIPGSTSSTDEPDRFGYALAFGDFNRDGSDDLAVGAPGSPVAVDGVRKRDAGTVTVLYSDGWQLATTNAAQITQQTSGIPGISGAVDRFGFTLAAGDHNGDRDDELAIYSPGDTYVTVVPGTSGGLAYSGAKTWTQNTSGIPGTTEPGDYWGISLRFAHVKNATWASLLVGAPEENGKAGACTVIHGSGSGLTATGAQYFSQNTSGIPGTAELEDRFGFF
jgi:hypothetical protein